MNKTAQFWILALLLYVAALYGTGLHLIYGPDHVLDLGYAFHAREYPELTSHLAPGYPDIGLLQGQQFTYEGAQVWKLTSAWPEAAFNLEQVHSPETSVPPYKYRVLPAYAAKILSIAAGHDVAKGFIVLNVVLSLLTALLFTYFQMKHLAFKPITALAGGLILMILIGSSAVLPVVQPACMFFSILLFIAAFSRNAVLFGAAALGAIATHEVFLIAPLLWLLVSYPIKDTRSVTTFFVLLLTSVAGYMAIRAFMGGEYLNYGEPSALSQGIVSVVAGIFMSFTFLWAGLLRVNINTTMLRAARMESIVMLWAILFSQHVAQILLLLYPIVIPGFLELVREMVERLDVVKIDTA